MAHVTDPYRDVYAARTAHMTGSEIRALFAVTQRPEVISLAGGLPYTEAMPSERVLECAEQVLRDHRAEALQYGSAFGVGGLKECLSDYMAEEGVASEPHEIVITNGAQQGLELLTKVFIDPGDIVITEAPTYVGALSAFASFQTDVRAVALDDDGIIPADLDATFDGVRAEGCRPKFLYLVPTFQNPSGITLSASRRLEVLDICRRHNVLVIEDNPYARVRFEGEPISALRTLAPDQVIYVGSLSKVFSAGMRIGWVLAPEHVRERLVLAKEAADLCSSPFTQLVAEAYLRSGHAPEDLQRILKIYRDRRDTLLDGVEQFFPPGSSTSVPQGGLFCWVKMPRGIDAKALLPRALEAAVAYVPGTGFYPDGRGRDCMRLNFSFPSPDRIEEGMRRLGTVIGEELELARSLDL